MNDRFRILSETDVESLIDLESMLPVVENALIAQEADAVVRPERPHYPIGAGLDGPDALGMGLTMPAYIEGSPYVVTKLATVHEDNPVRGLPTVNATVAVGDARNGVPLAYMAGNGVTNVRTGCIGGVTAAAFTDGEIDLGVIGAGTQARWQTRAIDAATAVGSVRIFSPSDSKYACAAELNDHGIDTSAVETPAAALSGSDVVVTATTSSEPVFAGDDLEAGTLVIAVGAFDERMQELDRRTIERADALYADVPEEAIETGDIPDDHADRVQSLGTALEHPPSRNDGSIVVVKSVGSAVLDAAAAGELFETAERNDVGTIVQL